MEKTKKSFKKILIIVKWFGKRTDGFKKRVVVL